MAVCLACAPRLEGVSGNLASTNRLSVAAPDLARVRASLSALINPALTRGVRSDLPFRLVVVRPACSAGFPPLRFSSWCLRCVFERTAQNVLSGTSLRDQPVPRRVGGVGDRRGASGCLDGRVERVGQRRSFVTLRVCRDRCPPPPASWPSVSRASPVPFLIFRGRPCRRPLAVTCVSRAVGCAGFPLPCSSSCGAMCSTSPPGPVSWVQVGRAFRSCACRLAPAHSLAAPLVLGTCSVWSGDAMSPVARYAVRRARPPRISV